MPSPHTSAVVAAVAAVAAVVNVAHQVTHQGADTVLLCSYCFRLPAGYPHRLAAACDDGAVRLFGVEGGEPGAHLERVLASFEGRVLALAWHPDGGTLVAGGMDGCVHLLDATTGVCVRSLHTCLFVLDNG